MKKLIALLLALVLCVSLVACGGSEPAEPEQDEAHYEEAVTDPALVPLANAYNEVAPLYNEIYAQAEANGWLADEQTVAELNAVAGTLGVIGEGLTTDPTLLEGADLDGLTETLNAFVPELEKMLERVSVPYEG